MKSQPDLRFRAFTLDRANQQLRRASVVIPLPPKTFAVLQYLAENPQRLVTHAELLSAVWPGVAVGNGLLRGYLRDIRRALGDDAANPKFIATQQRLGFRFLPEVDFDSFENAQGALPSGRDSTPVSALVGRDHETRALADFLRESLNGQRQVVLIAGEPGIGKSALVGEFVTRATAQSSVIATLGQCVEQYGIRDSYLPIFDALESLCRGPRATSVIRVLSRHAPVWLSQLPRIDASQHAASAPNVQDRTQAGMLRELCEALEVIAAEMPLILVLEDLQWSDNSTLDLLSAIAHRREPARLMVIGTYRPAEVIVSSHPLRTIAQELQAHRLSRELWPYGLNVDEVRRFLDQRFVGNGFPERMAQMIHANSAGNPLFMTTLIDDLMHQNAIMNVDGQWRLGGDLDEVGTKRPESLRKLIEARFERLSARERSVIEAAAVTGIEFTADLIAAALEIETADVEDCCNDLVRRSQFLAAASPEQPTGAGAQFTFRHDLYRSAALARTSFARRVLWCQRIAEHLASGDDRFVKEVSGQIAFYFEQAGLPQQAAKHCLVAAERCSEIFADSEAVEQFRRGIKLLQNAPASEARDDLELRLQVGLATSLTKLEGLDSDEIDAALRRATALNQRVADAPQAFATLRLLVSLQIGRADFPGSLDFCDRMDDIAGRHREPIFEAEAKRLRGLSSFFLGRCAEARDSLEKSISIFNQSSTQSHSFAYAEDPRVFSSSVLAIVLWMQGYPDQALARSQEGVRIATEIGEPYSVALAHYFLANLMRFLRDIPGTLRESSSTIAICQEHGFALWRAQASLERGWALAMSKKSADGIKEIEAALGTQLGSVGAGGSIAKLADACLCAKKTSRGLSAVNQGLEHVQKYHEGMWAPELHRLKGELLLQKLDAKKAGKRRAKEFDQAEQCFLTAIDRAKENGARSLELRAATSLCRLFGQQSKPRHGRRRLEEVYRWFTEGLETPDLIDAKALLKNG
ncbi:MAG TPA: AAA family ATPase [Candidatus Binataceae bacterium]|nr:AAA family ATPase [Candidatus Binataceae bacterium]